MTSSGADSNLFKDLAHELLRGGMQVRFQARGASMSPTIRDGEIVQVIPVIVSKLRKGDIVLSNSSLGFRLHRLVMADHNQDMFFTRGDCGLENDPMVRGNQILGIAQAKEVRLGRKIVRARLRGIGGRLVRCVARAQAVFEKLLRIGNDASQRKQSSSAVRGTV